MGWSLAKLTSFIWRLSQYLNLIMFKYDTIHDLLTFKGETPNEPLEAFPEGAALCINGKEGGSLDANREQL